MARVKKRFGQHFLSDPIVVGSLLRAIAPSRGDRILEIGPGRGVISRHLAQLEDVDYVGVEKDRDLVAFLRESYPDINILSDVQAVKRSVRNLVLMNQYEKPFRPEIYSGIRDQLFEPMTPLTATILAKKVEDVIENFEPRARLQGVRANPDLDRNAYNIAIEFYVVNVPTELVDLTVILERLR